MLFPFVFLDRFKLEEADAAILTVMAGLGKMQPVEAICQRFPLVPVQVADNLRYPSFMSMH
ncbi:hypothetical protein AK51_23705 [Serratia nematodiphila DZ0503SBS1]|nr:hypothetical protein AK51_23705 [Serratia nematodiphila DZ0503SBS1]